MNQKPRLIASDLEGVFIPEVWINVAEKTGVPDLRLTTRDIKDYNQLMEHRMAILKKEGISLSDIQAVIRTIEPLPGATDFLKWVRRESQIIILSDTFYEFAGPFMQKLDYPALFCHTLITDTKDMITGYRLRINDSKKKAVEGFTHAGFSVIAMGDSYNDTAMLAEADTGILFHAPDNVKKDFPQFECIDDFITLKDRIALLCERSMKC